MFLFLRKKPLVKRAALVGAVLVLLTGFLFVSCSELGGILPEQPSIISQPNGGIWDVSDKETFTITVTVGVTDGGQLSYQWYLNTSAANSGGTTVGTNSPTLTLAKANYTANNEYYFYVVVTNTINDSLGNKKATTTSNAITVIVIGNDVMVTVIGNDGPPGSVNAEHPDISVQPAATTNWDVSADAAKTLTVTANVADGGTLSYQWYSNASAANSGGTALGTNSAALSLAKANYTTNDSYYFYVVITNTITDNGDGGNKTASVTSSVATVTVTGNTPAYVPFSTWPTWYQTVTSSGAFSIQGPPTLYLKNSMYISGDIVDVVRFDTNTDAIYGIILIKLDEDVIELATGNPVGGLYYPIYFKSLTTYNPGPGGTLRPNITNTYMSGTGPGFTLVTAKTLEEAVATFTVDTVLAYGSLRIE